jgi:CHAT domain-containing protein
MRHAFFHRMQWLMLMVSLMGLWGCAGLMEALPTPPAFLAPIALHGPYDADIPTPLADQIKRASLLQDGAVPYIFIGVATHFESLGDQVRSIHFFNRAIEGFRQRKNIPGEGSAFGRKISSLYHFGEIQTAYLVMEELAKKWSNTPLNAFVFYNYGYYYLKNGDYAKACKYFGQSLAANLNDNDNPDLLALRRDTELGYGRALILADYFPVVSRKLCLSDFDEAFYRNIRRNLSEGLSHLKRVPDLNNAILKTDVIRYFPGMTPSFIECDLHNLLGLSYGMAGQEREAVKSLEKAAGIAQKADYRLGEADSIFFLNQIYLLNKNRSEGIKSAQDLNGIADRYQLPSYAIWAKMILAHHYKEAGDIGQTMDSLNEALRLMENNVSWLSRNVDFRGIGFFQRQSIYEVLLDLRVSTGDERGAFQTAERAKAATFVDRLGEEVIGRTPAGLEIIKRTHLYRQQMAEYYTRLLSPANGGSVFLNTVEKMGKARRAYRAELDLLKDRDGALYSLVRVVPRDAGETQRLLDDNTTLFTYYIGEQYLFIWVINKNGFHQTKIRMSRNDVDRLVHAYLGTMMSKDINQINALSEKVYDTFLKPVIPFVYGDRVGFVPHGTLYKLPFASMRYVKAYLVDGFTIFYLPHAGMMKQALPEKSAPPTKKALIFAAPQRVEKQSVAHVETETEILKRIFPRADYFMEANISRDKVQKLTGIYDLIHFASDCYLTEEAPLDSCLILGATEQRHGCLSARDVFHLQLSARATILGDCRRESGPSSAGTGMSTLMSAWLYAVSPSVIASLWKVEDKSRAAWVDLFYKNLEKSGNMAEALRAAQNDMIHMGYGPSDWAAFVVTGPY